MKTLFEQNATSDMPLAEQLRPTSLDQLVGQEALLGQSHMLRQMLASRRPVSLVLWGPPGCGKTTLARIIAEQSGYEMDVVSAVASGTAELKEIFARARIRAKDGRKTVVFVDEIHRFNRAQQDVFLPVVEDGTIVLIGATTENPSFEINSALLSRMQVVVMSRLEQPALEQLMLRAEAKLGKLLPLTQPARLQLIAMADGDGRALLNFCELVAAYQGNAMDAAQLAAYVQKRAPVYDKKQDGHYNLISALHKSLRGSDVDAALYWFSRMLEGGENPLYIARRLVRFAAEDIGMADPEALMQANAAREAYEFLGSPEGELALAQAVVYLATAPKSNAVYVAAKAAARSARSHGSLMPPAHILNAPTTMMKALGYGADYAYDHDEEDGFSGQNYFPETMARQQFYKPNERGFEREIIKRLDYWQKLREKKG